MVSQRDERIDILKGIAIFLVVLGHINAPEKLTDFIYSFHMPLFMFLSGCTFWYSFKKKIQKMNIGILLKDIRNRFLALIIPFCIWSLIYGFALKKNTTLASALTDAFGVYWFLPTLFGIFLIFSIAEYISEKMHSDIGFKHIAAEITVILILSLAVIIAYFITGFKIFREIIIYLPAFYLGITVKKYEFISKLFSNQYIFTCCIIISSTIIPFYSRADRSFIVLIIRFIAGITVTEVLYCYINFIVFNNNGDGALKTGTMKLFEYFGYHSLDIYIISEFFNPLFLPENRLNSFNDAVLKAIYSVIICFLCIIVSSILRQSDFLGTSLFGTKKNVQESLTKSNKIIK